MIDDAGPSSSKVSAAESLDDVGPRWKGPATPEIVRPKKVFRNSGHARKTVRAETDLEYHRYERVDVAGFPLPSPSSQRPGGPIPNPLSSYTDNGRLRYMALSSGGPEFGKCEATAQGDKEGSLSVPNSIDLGTEVCSRMPLFHVNGNLALRAQDESRRLESRHILT